VSSIRIPGVTPGPPPRDYLAQTREAVQRARCSLCGAPANPGRYVHHLDIAECSKCLGPVFISGYRRPTEVALAAERARSPASRRRRCRPMTNPLAPLACPRCPRGSCALVRIDRRARRAFFSCGAALLLSEYHLTRPT
jgi:hypothetical protein